MNHLLSSVANWLWCVWFFLILTYLCVFLFWVVAVYYVFFFDLDDLLSMRRVIPLGFFLCKEFICVSFSVSVLHIFFIFACFDSFWGITWFCFCVFALFGFLLLLVFWLVEFFMFFRLLVGGFIVFGWCVDWFFGVFFFFWFVVARGVLFCFRI